MVGELLEEEVSVSMKRRLLKWVQRSFWVRTKTRSWLEEVVVVELTWEREEKREELDGTKERSETVGGQLE